MIQKLSLWVCPQIGCPKLSGKPGECPTHHKNFVRRVYVQANLTGTKGDMGDILSNLFGKK